MAAASSLTARVVLRVSLICILICSAVILLNHGRGSSNSSLLDLVAPRPGCSVPCFMGIRPGETTLDVGLRLLRASPLIRLIAPAHSSRDSRQPSDVYDVDFVEGFGAMRTAQIQLVTRPGSGIIESVLLADTGIPLTELNLTFGQSEPIILDDPHHLGLATYVGFYPQFQMYVQSVLAVCSPEAWGFQGERHDLLIGIASVQKYAQQRSYYAQDDDQIAEGWQQQLYDLKRTDCA